MAEETAMMKHTREVTERQGLIPAESAEWFSVKGMPMVMISCCASELINTGNFSNVTVGPLIVRRFVQDGPDESIAAEIRRTQMLCEAAVAEERQTIQALLRSNARMAAK